MLSGLEIITLKCAGGADFQIFLSHVLFCNQYDHFKRGGRGGGFFARCPLFLKRTNELMPQVGLIISDIFNPL